MTFLINTFLGFAIAQIADILNRDKASDSSPIKFDVWFFIKDTWLKILLSLLLSTAISLLVFMNAGDFSSVIGDQWLFAGNIIYALIGFAPELLLQKLKKKYGVLQPKEVGDFTRK